ncbi:IclR family transcriptional regulator [Cryobacterium sp. MLB-32]|uniref:IclR family transcriptional regulator n=1 Tax=Cryobacterium sp. MLB-32 TaxID=1529318 RepID=UPI0005649DF9|nr:IclR family transcriptional regulator C-terminal domain-containing protein [Cryobacterium sp. MLB-32]
MTAGNSQTLISSIQRALKLVDIVANANRPLPVKVIAQLSGLSLGTTYNITRTLVHEGYLATEPDGLVLGGSFPGLRPGDEDGVFLARGRQTLRSVADELGATAYLSRFTDGEVQILDIVDAAMSPRVELWVGIVDSAHATALGKQILAELCPEQRADYLSRHPPEGLTPHTISDRRSLLRELDDPGDAAVDRQEYAIGYTCVAVGVRAPGVIGSLAISLPSDRADTDLHDTIRTLQASAAHLSLQLGAARFGQFTI